MSRNTKWMVYAKKEDFEGIGRQLGISPVLARLVRNRDVIGPDETAAYLSATTKDLRDPFLLPDMEIACGILQDKIRNGKSIRIIGDYDVDGICSAYILLRVLRSLGAKVDAKLPDRVIDGYGINERLVREAISDGVDTILTCDNGIAAKEPLTIAKDAGMTVIVTDHHEVPYELIGEEKHYLLPPADAVIDPKRQSDAYPFPEICGAVVALKLCQALQKKMNADIPAFDQLLAFAALATVCDVMPLRDENRIIVRTGLQIASNTRNTGLNALIRVCDLSGRDLSVYHAGFILGPCLNASGRLNSAERALELFSEEDENRALLIAQELKSLNESRKDMTLRGTETACRMIESGAYQGDQILVILLEDCHESLAGIIAGRVRERYHRPAFVLTRLESGVIKGSGRSAECYNMFDGLTQVQDLLLKFGGHAMAAGLTLAEENVDEFRRRLNENCTLTDEDFAEVLHLDMELPPEAVSIPLVQEFSQLEPCGTGNPRPLFAARNVLIQRFRILGKNGNVIKFSARSAAGVPMELIYFGMPEEVPELMTAGEKIVNIAYYPDINRYQGRENIQFVLRDYKIT